VRASPVEYVEATGEERFYVVLRTREVLRSVLTSPFFEHAELYSVAGLGDTRASAELGLLIAEELAGLPPNEYRSLSSTAFADWYERQAPRVVVVRHRSTEVDYAERFRVRHLHLKIRGPRIVLV
jgi:hypothetical protein